MQSKSKKQITSLEDKIDAVEGLASLAETEGTISLETYLKSRGKSTWTRAPTNPKRRKA